MVEDGPTRQIKSERCLMNQEDQVVEKFLEFLAKDIDEHPERLQALSVGFVQRARELAASIKCDIDIDAPLPDEDGDDVEVSAEGVSGA